MSWSDACTGLGLLLACALGKSAEAADPRFTHLIDTVCIGTAVDQQKMAAMMPLLQAREMPREQAANMPALRAWSFADSGSLVIAGYNSRVVDGQNLRDCVLAFPNGSHTPAMRSIEASYRLSRIFDETQGTQRVTSYVGNLIGVPDTLVTIQSRSAAAGILTITLTQGAKLPR